MLGPVTPVEVTVSTQTPLALEAVGPAPAPPRARQRRLLRAVDRVGARLDAASRAERLEGLDATQREALDAAVAADRVVLTALRAEVLAAGDGSALEAARDHVRALRCDDHRALLRTAVAARRFEVWAAEVADLYSDDPDALAVLAEARTHAETALAQALQLGVTSTRSDVAAVRRRLAAAVDLVWVLHEGQ